MYCVVQLQWDGVDGLSLCRFNTYLGKDESVILGKELVQVIYIIVKRVNVSQRQLPVNLRDDEMPVRHLNKACKVSNLNKACKVSNLNKSAAQGGTHRRVQTQRRVERLGLIPQPLQLGPLS